MRSHVRARVRVGAAMQPRPWTMFAIDKKNIAIKSSGL